jgi:hypothetical protein
LPADSGQEKVEQPATCPCHLNIALLDSAERLMHAAARGMNVQEMAKRWLEEDKKRCPVCPRR